MHTPVADPTIFDSLEPDEALVAAWTVEGPSAGWHRAAKEAVREAMPVLARALDRMVAQWRG